MKIVTKKPWQRNSKSEKLSDFFLHINTDNPFKIASIEINKMKQPKQQHHHDITLKLSLLQSNANRVKHQNTALLKLLSQRPLHQTFIQFSNAVEELCSRFQNAKRKHSQQASPVSIKNTSNIDEQIRRAQLELQHLRDRIHEWQREEHEGERMIGQSINRQILKQKNADEEELLRMKKHISKYLSSIERQKNEKINRQVMDHAIEALERQAEPYCQDLQSDLGILICEIEYLNELQIRTQIQQKLESIPKDLSSQLQLGYIEREAATLELSAFATESQNRLNYQSRLLVKKFQKIWECFSLNSQNPDPKVLAAIFSRYNQQIEKCTQRLHHLTLERRGMKIRQSKLVQQLKQVDQKIEYLKGESHNFPMMQQKTLEVDKNIEKCENLLHQFLNLKGSISTGFF